MLLLGVMSPGGLLADAGDLVCRESGLAGVSFGQPIAAKKGREVERADSGVVYFAIRPVADIAPFTSIVVGVTPKSRHVFAIHLRLLGSADEVSNAISVVRSAFLRDHPDMRWSTSDQHHYAEGVENLDIALYPIALAGETSGVVQLHYDCDNVRIRGQLMREMSD